MPLRSLVGAILIPIAVLLGGCATATIDEPFDSRQIESEVAFSPDRQVVIEGDNGDVTVRRTDATAAKVRAEIRGKGKSRLASVQVVMQANPDGDLSIRVDWPIGWRQPGEAATLEVELPGCSGLTVHTGNGAIDVTGLAGKAVLDSGNGSVTLSNHSGEVELNTSNGSVEARQIAGACRVRTSNGRVELVDIAGRVSVATTNGAVEATLTEENPGPVDIRTANGAVELQIGQGFTGDLRLETFNGRVRVVGVSGEVEVDDEREWAVIHRGGTANRSLVRTSNGRIEVRPR